LFHNTIARYFHPPDSCDECAWHGADCRGEFHGAEAALVLNPAEDLSRRRKRDTNNIMSIAFNRGGRPAFRRGIFDFVSAQADFAASPELDLAFLDIASRACSAMNPFVLRFEEVVCSREAPHAAAFSRDDRDLGQDQLRRLGIWRGRTRRA